MTDTLRLASGRFARGFNCAQSVFSAFAGQLGLSTDFALRLAAPFGAGLGRETEVCGALTGALMVLGLQYSNDRPEGKEATYSMTREFVERFREQHGAVRCRELLGYDISTAEGLQAARDHNTFGSVCPLIVEATAMALTQYLSDHPKP